MCVKISVTKSKSQNGKDATGNISFLSAFILEQRGFVSQISKRKKIKPTSFLKPLTKT
jgi:hypothetical protein